METNSLLSILKKSNILPLILFGPSGAGKTAVKKRLMERYPDLFGFSISATTRNKRANEKDCEDYFFLTKEEFLNAKSEGQFFEWQEVYPDLHPNGYYGTLNSEIERIINQGKVPLLDIDVDGALDIIDRFGNEVFSAAIIAPKEKLEESVNERKLDSNEHIVVRLNKAPLELAKIMENADRITIIRPRIENGLDLMIDEIMPKYESLSGIKINQ